MLAVDIPDVVMVLAQAKHHFLVLPRPTLLKAEGPQDLRHEHLSQLRCIHSVGSDLVNRIRKQARLKGEKAPDLKMGYHALPSMEPLHMHVISQARLRLRVPHLCHVTRFPPTHFRIFPHQR